MNEKQNKTSSGLNRFQNCGLMYEFKAVVVGKMKENKCWFNYYIFSEREREESNWFPRTVDLSLKKIANEKIFSW